MSPRTAGSLLDGAGIAFSSQASLRLIEGLGLIGTWSWTFASDEQTWSLGLYQLLGLEPGDVVPSYQALLTRLHPQDRAVLDSPQQIRQGEPLGSQTVVRVLRPDGSQRLLSSRTELYVAPDGRPRAAAGTLLDVTETEGLARVRQAEARARRALFEATQTWFTAQSFAPADLIRFQPSPELVELTGRPRLDLTEDIAQAIVPPERRHWHDTFGALIAADRPFVVTPSIVLAEGGARRLRAYYVPVRDRGRTRDWIIVNGPAEAAPAVAGGAVSGALRRGLEQAVSGRHLRAARALVGWSMQDLAAASGISFSTIRRLEEDAVLGRSHHAAVGALRRAGIRFALLDSGVIAVARG